MQNPIRRVIVAFAALLALSFTLSACTGSTKIATRTVTVSAKPSPSPKPEVVAVKLETDSKEPLGVIAHGTSWFHYPRKSPSQHRSYTCDSGLNPINLEINQQKQYQRTIVSLTQTGTTSVNKQGHQSYFQYGVTSFLYGDVNSFRLKSVSVIVHLYLNSKAHPDDRVINLGIGTFGNANAIQLDPGNFVSTSITGLTFCMLH